MDRILRLATRGSRLALWQAEHVRSLVKQQHPALDVELVLIKSTGDIVRDRPLSDLGGVGVFTKEIQQAVLDGRADATVHSLKDLPTTNDPRLVLAAVPERGPVGDALVAADGVRFEQLAKGARVATSSPRRRAQLMRQRPDLEIVDIRGNVETRIGKVRDGQITAVVLAEAGLDRLGLREAITERFSFEIIKPAVGQGALGIECRADDGWARELLSPLNHSATRVCVECERSVLRTLQGGCQVPLGVSTSIEAGELTIEAIVLSQDGARAIESKRTGPVEKPVDLGAAIAMQLLSRGAADLL